VGAQEREQPATVPFDLTGPATAISIRPLSTAVDIAPPAAVAVPPMSTAAGMVASPPAVTEPMDPGRPMLVEEPARPPAQGGPLQPPVDRQPWTWQVLPEGLIYHSYLAGVKEPRMASQWVLEKNRNANWETELGCRVGVVRYGTDDSRHPQGWEFDLEGAAFPRLNLHEQEDVTSVDYRFGAPLTFGYGNYQMKLGYFHICSHLGDEFMLRNPTVERVNYVRNGLAWGHSYNWTDAVRLYAESAWAFEYSGGAKPWEFQFGIEYSPEQPTGCRPKPFVAVNTDLRQEVNFGGNLVIETGYQWRGETNHVLRAGLQYFTGKSDQYEFFNQYEEKFGLGLWYDF
jgi:hypothetical protein